ncbi:MAG TPA: protein-L-isoaspartate O-methyltransferase [Steroidobacteraceae bacterium]|nr:protein-L-isoaspartate O-methyltransferase [Steroidobacteraceae bacterium]
MSPNEFAREQMVQQQIRAWDVLDERVLDTFRSVPRELFVPAEHRFLAFADVEVPLPNGQHMLRPSVAGRLLQSLELTGAERALEIGAGSGFVSACLAVCCASVRAIEIFADLAALAQANLSGFGARNVEVVTADATRLASERYDVIAVTASLPAYDERFQRLLTVGGRLFVVVGEPPVMEACLVRCVAEGAWARESLFETVVDPLINAQKPSTFIF